MRTSLARYIERIYNQPYNAICNNCAHSAGRVYKRAKRLGVRAELVLTFSIMPKTKHFPPWPSLHMHTVVEGNKIDVHLSPEQEERLYKIRDVRTCLQVVIARCGGESDSTSG